MSYTNGLDKPSDYFETKLYTGDDTNNREISLGLTPDLTWIKARNVAYGHILFDRIRGLGFSLNSNNTNADRNVGSEFGWSNSGCTTDSFTVDRGSNESLNESGRPMVAWNWKAGGTASSNTNGSITSSVSANQDAGFSIVSYTGTGSNATVGHSLGTVPSMVIVKRRSNTENWTVYHNSIGNTKYLNLDTTDSATTFNLWQNTDPTSSVFSITTHNRLNANGDTYIAYCFSEKKGYSKFGSYTGNGNADGTFVYTGFKPAFIMQKSSSVSGTGWHILDVERSPSNSNFLDISANSSGAEFSGSGYRNIDFLSNGFKIRVSAADLNQSGGTYIYMAFAENPFVTSTGIPSCAR